LLCSNRLKEVYPDELSNSRSTENADGAIAFKKRRNRKGELVDTLEYSDEDEIALDYKVIQQTFGTDFYNIYHREEVFNKFLKKISL